MTEEAVSIIWVSSLGPGGFTTAHVMCLSNPAILHTCSELQSALINTGPDEELRSGNSGVRGQRKRIHTVVIWFWLAGENVCKAET